MKVLCKSNKLKESHPEFHKDKEYDLIPGKTYLVMAMYKPDKNIFYVLDESTAIYTFPSELFEIVDKRLPSNWYFNILSEESYVLPSFNEVWGYYEFCYDEDHRQGVVEIEKDDLLIYLQRKIETEKYFDELDSSPSSV